MARRRKPLVPEARDALDRLKMQVIRDQVATHPVRQPDGMVGMQSTFQRQATAGDLMNTLGIGHQPVFVHARNQAESRPIQALAQELGIPYQSRQDNGNLTTRQAGKIGGHIGGPMVKRLIALAQSQLADTAPDAPLPRIPVGKRAK